MWYALTREIMNWDSSERRRFVRVKLPCQITVRGPKEYTLSTHIENISAGGVRFLATEKLEVLSVVEIDIYGIKKDPILCRGRILWVFSRNSSGSQKKVVFDTGVEFCKINHTDRKAIKDLIVLLASGKS